MASSSPPSDTNSWEMSQPRTTECSVPLTEREPAEMPLLSGICDRPRLRLVRNTPPDEPSGSLLRRSSEGSIDATGCVGTGRSMTETMTAPPPQLLRTLTQRPATSIRASAKTISAVRPEVVVPAAADPAVLVHVHSDLRLSLAQLSSETDTTLAPHYVVTRLATGCVDLAPQDPDEADDTDEVRDTPAGFLTLRTDDRRRLVITRGILHRLAAEVGDKLLVTLDPGMGGLRLLNLATLADAVEACLAGSGEVSS